MKQNLRTRTASLPFFGVKIENVLNELSTEADVAGVGRILTDILLLIHYWKKTLFIMLQVVYKSCLLNKSLLSRYNSLRIVSFEIPSMLLDAS